MPLTAAAHHPEAAGLRPHQGRAEANEGAAQQALVQLVVLRHRFIQVVVCACPVPPFEQLTGRDARAALRLLKCRQEVALDQRSVNSWFVTSEKDMQMPGAKFAGAGA